MSHFHPDFWRPVRDRLGQMRPLDLMFVGTGLAAAGRARRAIVTPTSDPRAACALASLLERTIRGQRTPNP